MSSIENNNEDWKEMRARIDSIASAIFLIGGGSLSLSITVILSNLKKLTISSQNINLIETAWVMLSISIILVLFMKIFVLFQTLLLQSHTDFASKHHMKFNFMTLIIGIVSFGLFCGGFYYMVKSAVHIIGT